MARASRGLSAFLLLGSGLSSLAACGAGPTPSPAQPKTSVKPRPEPAPPGAENRLTVRVLAEYPHDAKAYTQGLLWHEGSLYESTGLYGSSSLREVRLEDGQVLRQVDHPRSVFGEGLALVGDRLLQLSWKEETLFEWSLGDFARLGERHYSGEGWGLCFDGKELVSSDGSAVLTFHQAGDYRPTRRLEVKRAGEPLTLLNELECVGGEIYANVYTTDEIVRIDPASGRVTATIDASGLLSLEERARAEVLNGLAYRPETKTFLITGKLWPKLFEVTFVPAR